MLAMCALGTVALNIPLILLFCFSERLGWIWTLLILLYFAILITVYALILRPRQLAHLRYELGDALFFELYPKEKEKELRRNARTRAARRKKLERQRQRELRRRGL